MFKKIKEKLKDFFMIEMIKEKLKDFFARYEVYSFLKSLHIKRAWFWSGDSFIVKQYQDDKSGKQLIYYPCDIGRGAGYGSFCPYPYKSPYWGNGFCSCFCPHNRFGDDRRNTGGDHY